MIRTATPLAALATLLLVGCSSAPRVPEYACPLQTSDRAKCATMDEALQASRNLDTSVKSQSVFDPSAQRAITPSAVPAATYSAAPSTLASPPNGAPVFSQPKVYRPWVPAYQGADGVLYADQYKYFSTPGQWNYGSLKKPGSAAGAPFEPARPLTRGANVVDAPTPQRNPSPAAPVAGRTATPAPATRAGITQPAQPLETPGGSPSANNSPSAAAAPTNISVPRSRFSTD